MTTKKEPWKSDNWFVSPFNFADEVTKKISPPKQVKVLDTTLRDGEQTAGVVFTIDEKIRIAEKLAEIGVHRIEACYIGVSQDDDVVLKELVKRKLGSEIYAACRSVPADVKRAADCGVFGVYMGVPASPHTLQYAYEWTAEEAIERSIKASLIAKELGLYTCVFPIDGSRNEINWYLNFVDQIVKNGHVDALILADTYGVLSPYGAAYFTKKVKEKINKPLEIHFHNNFGMSTANTAAGVLNGGEVIHTTVLGLGEEAGNCPMEEIVMVLRAMYGIDVGIKYNKICEVAQLVSEITGMEIPSSRPFVGSRIYTIEAGLTAHTYQMVKDKFPLIKFPVLHQFIGHESPQVVLGKYSGVTNVELWADKLGISLTKDEIKEVMDKIKVEAIKIKRLLTEDEFRKIAQSVKTGKS